MLPAMNSPPLLRFTLPADFVCTPLGDEPDMSDSLRRASPRAILRQERVHGAD
jgi:hypothetical protein